ncbi:MAG TPA: DUF4214 domain-containing protein [Pyrinomonadaceae bacterium]|jgi:hypothetical protein
MKTTALCFILTLAVTVLAAAEARAVTPVHINFDGLANNTVVTNQYSSANVIFSTNNISYPAHTQNTCSCYTSSAPNFISTIPSTNTEVILDFIQPVNNLTFYIIGVNDYGVFAKADVYQNGSSTPQATISLSGYYNTYPFFYNFSSYTNITKLRFHSITDTAGIGFDDFDFVIPDVQKVEISNPRVGTIANNSTQNALLGANVDLQAKITPAGLTGGTYQWFIAAPYQLASGTINDPSIRIYWTQPGTYQAQVTYTRNGVSVSSTIYVNVVLPTLNSFTAQQNEDLLGPGGFCGPGTFLWSLGCRALTGGEGINFTTTVQIPSASYLSDPAQSGIKFVQAISAMRKVRNSGRDPNIIRNEGLVQCLYSRANEGDVNSGWRIDNRLNTTGDPYENSSDAVRYFSQGNTLTIVTRDSPAQGWDDLDAVKVDDRFQMYVVYFAGGSHPGAPIFQRRIGSLTWNWGGEVVYDSVNRISSNTPYRKLLPLYAQPGSRNRDAVVSNTTYQGLNSDLNFGPCLGAPATSYNPIDGSRFFVQQLYLDVLNRQADANWDYWTSYITQCAFDGGCMNGHRITVARGFLESGEFIQAHPALADASTHVQEYVRQCYLVFLYRNPDAGGYNHYVDYLNQTGDYDGVVSAFINSTEYRQRFGPP